MDDWKIRLEQEFEMALRARERKNEGQARVCARRAAGVAIREYLRRRGMTSNNPSAYDLLNFLLQLPDLPPGSRQSAEYLTLRVTEEFKLPVDVDLVAEARTLSEALLAE